MGVFHKLLPVLWGVVRGPHFGKFALSFWNKIEVDALADSRLELPKPQAKLEIRAVNGMFRALGVSLPGALTLRSCAHVEKSPS